MDEYAGVGDKYFVGLVGICATPLFDTLNRRNIRLIAVAVGN